MELVARAVGVKDSWHWRISVTCLFIATSTAHEAPNGLVGNWPFGSCTTRLVTSRFALTDEAALGAYSTNAVPLSATEVSFLSLSMGSRKVRNPSWLKPDSLAFNRAILLVRP